MHNLRFVLKGGINHNCSSEIPHRPQRQPQKVIAETVQQVQLKRHCQGHDHRRASHPLQKRPANIRCPIKVVMHQK